MRISTGVMITRNRCRMMIPLTGKVWLCWWQGIDNAPALVQRCVESIQRNVKEHDVIILTDENYRRYVDIPDWIVEKYHNGIISRTRLTY